MTKKQSSSKKWMKALRVMAALIILTVVGINLVQRKKQTGPNAVRDAWVSDNWQEISSLMKEHQTRLSFKQMKEIEVISVDYTRSTAGARAVRQMSPPCPVVPVLEVASHAEAKNAMAQPIKPIRVRVNESVNSANVILPGS